MQKTYKIILLCIFQFALSSRLMAQVPDLPFGVYKDSVKAALAKQTCVKGFESNGYDNHFYLNYKQYQHNGAACGLLLTFYRNKLGGYIISDYRAGKQAKKNFKKLERSMTKAYGKPTISEHSAERNTLSWVLEPKTDKDAKQVTIELVSTEANDYQVLETYVGKDEYAWRQANPEKKTE